MNEIEYPAGDRHWYDHTAIKVLRWFAVVPAAVLAGWLAHNFGGLFLFLREPFYPQFLFPLAFLIPAGAGFTFVGALTAPSRRIRTAIFLAACCMFLSLQRHIFGQQNPGLTNYMHSTGESLGAAIGVAAVIYLGVRARRRLPVL